MKTVNGVIIIEINDHVTIVTGADAGVSGTVINVSGKEITVWGRQPGYLGSKSFRIQVPASSVRYVGKAILRPLRPGESRVAPPDLQVAAGGTEGIHAPTLRKPKQPPQPASVNQQPEPQETQLPPAPVIPVPAAQEIPPEMLKPLVVKRESAQDIFGKTAEAVNHQPKEQQNEPEETKSAEVQAEGDMPPDDLLPGEDDIPVRVEGAAPGPKAGKKRKA